MGILNVIFRLFVGSELFVLTTSLAALAHSTWTISTLFSGPEPRPQFDGAWFAWVLPGFLIAISFDVGMLSISHEIRRGERTGAKYLALAVLSISMFLLQWGYIAHHMPALALGAGVRSEWTGIATLLRDSLLWVIPALLPIAVTLHTFSSSRGQQPAERVLSKDESQIPTFSDLSGDKLPTTGTEVTETSAALSPAQPMIALLEPSAPTEHQAHCSHCGWQKSYPTKQAAASALSSHKRYCEAFSVVSSNGNENLVGREGEHR